MWFSNIRARAFGPLHSDKGDQLQFTSGLNVVHGPNETGKSSWHAALSAALCGRRRGPGRTTDDATFAERHRPWSSGEDGPWAVEAEMVRGDGTRVRFDRDLRLNETEVCDPELGDRRLVDLESEITHDGSPDGALLVGLNRSTFAMAASVRQAGVVSDLGNPDALQEQLARAAAGSDDATAARALERIESFRSEHVGRKRKNAIRPLPKAIDAEERARSELDAVRGRRDKYLDDMATADGLREAVGELEEERDRVHACAATRRAHDEAAKLVGKVHELEELSDRVGDCDAPELADVTPLAQAVSKVEAIGDPATTSLEPAELLVESMAELDAQMQSFPPAPEVAQVQQWVAPLRRLGAQNGAGEPAHPAPDSSRQRWKPAVAVAVVGLLCAIAASVVAGPVTAVGIGAATGVAVLLFVMRRGAPQASDRAEPTVTAEMRAALAKLDEAELPHGADAAVSTAAQRREELGGLQRRRDAAAHDVERRQRFDEAEQDRRANADAAWAALRDAAARHGIDAADADELVTQVRSVLNDHGSAQAERDAASAARGALEEALAGQSLEEWRARAANAQQAVDETQGALESLGASIADVGDAGEIERRLAAVTADLEKARSAADTATGKLEGIDLASVDIAAAEAALDEARAEHERVLRLDKTLSATARFMQEAADNTHRVLAPRIEEAVGALVSRVTDGRYTGVLVDPADLSVRLITQSGDRRDARSISRGTTEQVYLALRLVLAQVLSTGREQCPLLLDDSTVHADNERKQTILECLFDLAAERQIILFSQEQQVLEWARSRSDDGVHLIELGPAQPA
ncbi:MAG: AAA family ATPase [Acidimicrobiaceae bacterium]|nr:AAA family ATPase [Acidimicrobiaceae bacterium]